MHAISIPRWTAFQLLPVSLAVPEGISGKSQVLFALVFTTRYLDLFTVFISPYNTVMKVRRTADPVKTPRIVVVVVVVVKGQVGLIHSLLSYWEHSCLKFPNVT